MCLAVKPTPILKYAMLVHLRIELLFGNVHEVVNLIEHVDI